MSRILITGSQRLFRQGLKCILIQHFGEKVEIHECADESSISLGRDLQPEIIVLDADISVGSGLELTSRLVASSSRPKVVITTGKSEPVLLTLFAETGVVAFLTKSCPGDDLIEAITKAIQGGVYVSEKFSRLLAQGKVEKSKSIPLSELSRREMEVMLLLAEGRSADEIGSYLAISAKTVASYKQRIHGKLSTRNTADITRLAVQSGLLTSI